MHVVGKTLVAKFRAERSLCLTSIGMKNLDNLSKVTQALSPGGHSKQAS